MCAPSVRELLDAWERGLNQTPVQQALTLLGVANDPDARVGLAKLSIGQRNTRLLRLREALFGRHVVGVAACPACEEKLELSFDATALAPPPQVEPEKATMPHAPRSVEASPDRSTGVFAAHVAGRTWRFRLPNSEDLEAVASQLQEAGQSGANTGDAVHTVDQLTPSISAHQALLQRCLIPDDGLNGDATPQEADLPDEQAQQAIMQQMNRCDPQADMHVSLDCPACDHSWHVVFDIATFLWNEIHAWATQTLRETHQLASAYGWFEMDILSLSPLRRRLYLDMIGS